MTKCYLIWQIVKQEHKITKCGGSIKTGYVCPSYIKVHIDHKEIKVRYYSTHLWHTHDIGKQRLFGEDRSIIAGNLKYV